MDLGLAGKTALVTGASMGIGKAVALALASEGADVAIAARQNDTLASAVEHIREKTQARVIGIAADCSKASDVDDLVTSTIRELGRIDILVNCIGMARAGDFLKLSDQEWEDSIASKLMGQIRCCRAVLPQMQSRGWGRIVNVAGTQWKRPMPTSMPAGVTNAGLVNFTKALAEEAGPSNILVNIVSPGPIDTRRIEYLADQRAASRGMRVEDVRKEFVRDVTLGRLGQPEEIAQVVAFLVSERCTFITGAVIDVDGGYNKSL